MVEVLESKKDTIFFCSGIGGRTTLTLLKTSLPMIFRVVPLQLEEN